MLSFKYKKTIGLTGNDQSGKGLVCHYFNKIHRIPTFDGDLAFKFLINYDNQTLSDIKKHFGNICFVGKYLNITYFDTPDKMFNLLEVVEERVFKRFFKWKKSQNSDYVIFKCTVLHGIFNPVNFHKIVSVYCPSKISTWRRDLKYEPSDYEEKSPIEEYPFDYLNKNSDYVIIGDLKSDTLVSQINGIVSKLNSNSK